MRHLAVPAALLSLAISTPGSAQGHHPDAPDPAEHIAEQINDPDAIDAIADAMEATTGAMLAIPIGRLARAAAQMNPDSDLAKMPDNATVAELVDADEDMAERMGETARMAGHTMAGVTGEMARMWPVLEAMTHDLAAQLDQRIADARRGRR